MGRTAGQCSEGGAADLPAADVPLGGGGGWGRSVGFAGIKALFKPPADLLARRQQVIAGAARREHHNPHRFVPIAMTARIRRGLVKNS